MSEFVCNPYLPLYEYVPDGEPRVFEDRLYIYGSHDRAGGRRSCMEDFVVWSAPVDDLNQWRFDGVSYRREQDPHNPEGKWDLLAPDVVCGPDGRYYLFYCLRMQSEFGVAVSDSPSGPFEFYGHVHRPDGSIFQDYIPYDPAVLVDDDGHIYLYYGAVSLEVLRQPKAIPVEGCMVIELAPDMLTVVSEPVICLPGKDLVEGTDFEGHGYHSAPSIRKARGKYFLVYSSQLRHELCYAISSSPKEGFRFRGVIISNGDIGLNDRSYPVCLPGGNHGSLLKIRNQYYVFYTRYTHGTQFSRQGCAEHIALRPDGSIPQVEMTTGGISGNPIPARGTFSAARACVLSHRDGRKMLDFLNTDPETFPAIWTDTSDPDREKQVSYVRNITDGVYLGFKYFQAVNLKKIRLQIRGQGEGRIDLMTGDPLSGHCVGSMDISLLPKEDCDPDASAWIPLDIPAVFSGVHALYLVYYGTGSIDLKELTFL